MDCAVAISQGVDRVVPSCHQPPVEGAKIKVLSEKVLEKRFQNLNFRRTLTDLLEWSHNVQPFGTEDGHLAGNATGALNCRPHKWEDQPQAPWTDLQLSCASAIQTARAAESA